MISCALRVFLTLCKSKYNCGSFVPRETEIITLVRQISLMVDSSFKCVQLLKFIRPISIETIESLFQL